MPSVKAAADDALTDEERRLRRATFGLADSCPYFSAQRVITRRQAVAIGLLFLFLVAALAVSPSVVAQIVVAGMALGFVFSLLLRSTLAFAGRSPVADIAPLEDLPTYTVLVPVYREAGMIPQLAQALAALDYPSDKLDVSLVVEEDDIETLAAVADAGLHAVVVPPGEPRTKPKACNYALQMARGEFVVVYDAEDRPEPDQLRKAVAAFRLQPQVSCFQARLAIDHVTGWVQWMFCIDYDLWFRLLLPGLGRFNAPIPLGGTSNHFRTRALVDVGAWDPFNVTEDADLGMRLARLGHRVAILDSTTFEEAPHRLPVWLRQRTRWMKGYMQTLLVHSRNPRLLLHEIGFKGAVLIASFLGGAVWSSLVNPVMWLICICWVLLASSDGGILVSVARISGVSLLVANLLLATLAQLNRGMRSAGLLLGLTYPLYWLLISVAAYRALWQLLRDPFCWEKTPHGSAVE